MTASLLKDWQSIANAVFVIIKPFALSLSKGYSGSTSSPRTASFYCALAIAGLTHCPLYAPDRLLLKSVS